MNESIKESAECWVLGAEEERSAECGVLGAEPEGRCSAAALSTQDSAPPSAHSTQDSARLPPSSALSTQHSALALPSPRFPVRIRPAVAGDLGFIDELQKMHTRMVGWMPTGQLEAHIAGGNALIAEDEPPGLKRPVGYCLFKDRYFKREDVGIIYQLNVAPGRQRGLIGASLIKAAFERSAYGVRLFCCWCAQDIAANHFWESLGFVPLAFRAGSRGKADGGSRREGRVHIFWQRRIRAGDAETPYWYPSETSGGALRENRIVLPIPPGTHWSDAKPVLLPGMEMNPHKALEGEKRPRTCSAKKIAAPVIRKTAAVVGGLRFAPLPGPKPEKPKREKREKQKNDPKYVAAARELRDRYLERVNADRLLASPHGAQGKYDVSRQLAPGAPGTPGTPGTAPMADGELKHLPLSKARNEGAVPLDPLPQPPVAQARPAA